MQKRKEEKGLKNRFHIEMGIINIIPFIPFYSIFYGNLSQKNSLT